MYFVLALLKEIHLERVALRKGEREKGELKQFFHHKALGRPIIARILAPKINKNWPRKYFRKIYCHGWWGASSIQKKYIDPNKSRMDRRKDLTRKVMKKWEFFNNSKNDLCFNELRSVRIACLSRMKFPISEINSVRRISGQI